MDKGLIYQSKENNNAVFVGVDKNNEVKYCMERSTLSNSSFKRESKGSDKRFSFSIQGKNNSLYVFESPIDTLSYMSLNKNDKDLNNNHYLSLGGVSDVALNQYLHEHTQIKIVNLALDRDKAGIEAMNKLEERLKGMGYKVNKLSPEGEQKDWNLELQKRNERNLQLEQEKKLSRERNRSWDLSR